jgi:hypothetical protein
MFCRTVLKEQERAGAAQCLVVVIGEYRAGAFKTLGESEGYAERVN